MRTYPTNGARFCFQNGSVSRFETRERRLDPRWVSGRNFNRIMRRIRRAKRQNDKRIMKGKLTLR